MDHPNRPASTALRMRTVRGATAFVASAFGLLSATTASSALREYRVEFEPSTSASAAGYTLHIGTESGNYLQDFDLGSPPAQGGTVIYAVDLEDSLDLFVALRAYDANGTQSPPSNELQIAAVPIPRSDPPVEGGDSGGSDPTNGGGDSGGSDPTNGGGDSGGSEPTNGGGDSGGSDPIDIEPPPIQLREDVGLGIAAETGGLISTVLADGTLDFLTMDSLADPGDVRPVRCDLDGDGDQDLVLGFGKGSSGQVAVITLEDGGVASVASLLTGSKAYRDRNGETHPACGDMDGDDRAELVIGFGTLMRGVIQVFDDVETGFRPSQRGSMDANGFMTVPAPEESGRFKGEVYPAAGDVDGDGRAELVLGLGRTERAAYVIMLDDLLADFDIHPGNHLDTPWLTIRMMTYIAPTDRFSVMPTLGDIDGDGRDEIALSFGRGSGARVALLNDAIDGFPRKSSEVLLIATGRADYQNRDGETRVAMGDVDDDGVDELVVGFLRAGSHEVQVFDDLTEVLRPMGTTDGFVASAATASGIIPAPTH